MSLQITFFGFIQKLLREKDRINKQMLHNSYLSGIFVLGLLFVWGVKIFLKDLDFTWGEVVLYATEQWVTYQALQFFIQFKNPALNIFDLTGIVLILSLFKSFSKTCISVFCVNFQMVPNLCFPRMFFSSSLLFLNERILENLKC